MAERMVQVPVSLIERLRYMAADHVAFTAAEWDASADALAALLSQPTPCPECLYVEGHRDDCGRLDDYLAHREADPTRFEDMAPGTTFTADRAADGATFQWRWDKEGLHMGGLLGWLLLPPDSTALDPSTIRDVTPPKEHS